MADQLTQPDPNRYVESYASDRTEEYRPEKGWLARQFENVRRDVAEWPEWMKKESGRMEKNELTLPEMRERLEQLQKEQSAAIAYPLIRKHELLWLLELASAELARREREEWELAHGNVKCAACGYLGRQHFDLDLGFDHEFVPGSERLIFNETDGKGEWVPTESPVTDGEAG